MMDTHTNKTPFYRHAREVGGSIMIAIPPEILDHLDIKADDKLTLISDTNKKSQKYIAIWKN